MPATAETDTLPANSRPRSTSVPRGAAPEAKPTDSASAAPDSGGEQDQGRSSGRGRGSSKKKTGGAKKRTVAKAPEPLTPEELQALGALWADAAALGQSVEDYVQDLRSQLAAHDRLLEVSDGQV